MREPIRVLTVEDNRASCMLVGAFLEQAEGLELCGEAHDGWEGLELLHSQKPDLVLLDLVMPGLDGLGFLQALGEADLDPKPKIIVLSGVGSDEYIQRACRLGASYYLVKPVRLEELAARMTDLFPEAAEEPKRGVLAWTLLRMGADENCQGFYVACRGAALLAEGEGDRQLKEVYLHIAKELGSTYACVEKNLRTTIGQIHRAGGALYRENLGFGDREHQPDNGTFLKKLGKTLE